MKNLLIWNGRLCFCFCLYEVGLCSVSYIANEYFIYHFCIIIKDLLISFSRVIVIQDIQTVTFNVLFVHKLNIRFILNISTAIPFWSGEGVY